MKEKSEEERKSESEGYQRRQMQRMGLTPDVEIRAEGREIRCLYMFMCFLMHVSLHERQKNITAIVVSLTATNSFTIVTTAAFKQLAVLLVGCNTRPCCRRQRSERE